jgi:hypothetical protein
MFRCLFFIYKKKNQQRKRKLVLLIRYSDKYRDFCDQPLRNKIYE